MLKVRVSDKTVLLTVIYLYVFCLFLSFMYFYVDMHEQAHVQIYINSGHSRSSIVKENYIFGGWTNTTDQVNESITETNKLHSINEIVGYNLEPVFYAVVLLLITSMMGLFLTTFLLAEIRDVVRERERRLICN